jgi:hypothetical protein
MNVAVSSDPAVRRVALSKPATGVLDATARFWFIAALIGQWIFAYYTAVSYVKHVLQGDLAGMKAAMFNAYVTGDLLGNLAVAVHMTFALTIMVGGSLQLVPTIRARFPAFHRWNGRTYMLGVVIASLAGLLMIWGRGTYSNAVKLGGTGNALLVFACAGLTLRAALARDFIRHREWALRLFIAGSAVWFFRVILMAWVTAVGPLGINFETAEGPFLEIMAFGQYLIPLAVLEGYLRAKRAEHLGVRRAMAAALMLFTLVMCGGIVVASMGEWLSST